MLPQLSGRHIPRLSARHEGQVVDLAMYNAGIRNPQGTEAASQSTERRAMAA